MTRAARHGGRPLRAPSSGPASLCSCPLRCPGACVASPRAAEGVCPCRLQRQREDSDAAPHTPEEESRHLYLGGRVAAPRPRGQRGRRGRDGAGLPEASAGPQRFRDERTWDASEGLCFSPQESREHENGGSPGRGRDGSTAGGFLPRRPIPDTRMGRADSRGGTAEAGAAKAAERTPRGHRRDATWRLGRGVRPEQPRADRAHAQGGPCCGPDPRRARVWTAAGTRSSRRPSREASAPPRPRASPRARGHAATCPLQRSLNRPHSLDRLHGTDVSGTGTHGHPAP